MIFSMIRDKEKPKLLTIHDRSNWVEVLSKGPRYPLMPFVNITCCQKQFLLKAKQV